VSEARNMFPSRQVFSDKKRGDMLMIPKTEPVIGLFRATTNVGKGTVGRAKRFGSEAEAWPAYREGKLKMTDLVEIG
jgi:hypothetical protein